MEWRAKQMGFQAFWKLKEKAARFLICNAAELHVSARDVQPGMVEVAMGGKPSDLDYLAAKYSPDGWSACEAPEGTGWKVFVSSAEPALSE